MKDSSGYSPTAHFGAFEVDLRAGVLRKHGIKIRLQEQPFQILAMLLERLGQVVTREELHQKLWPTDTFVDFDHGLNNAINRLREALGDAADAPRFIETLPRRGYRFIAAVDGDSPASSPESPAPAEAEPIVPGAVEGVADATVPSGTSSLERPRLRKIWIAAAASAGLVALFIGSNVGGWRQRFFGTPDPGSIRSLAVLPLENLSGDPAQEYFADAMTEELITDLGKISTLKVISRTSAMQYKGTKKPLPHIARELSVDAIVEGAVVRSGDRVRITAQLIYAPTDRQLWAESYERNLSDILLLQSQVSQEIARQIQTKLTPQERAELARVHPVAPQTYELYLKGRYHFEKMSADGTKTAIEYFEHAIEQDPKYALAYAGLAECYVYFSPLSPAESIAKAKAAVAQALEIDEALGEAHASLADIRFRYEWEWSDADREYKRAIQLNPSFAEAHHSYSHYLMEMGRTEESLAESKRYLELDPLSPAANVHLGWHYLYARQYDQAIEQLEKALQIDPNYIEGHLCLGEAYEQKGMYQEAVARFQKAAVLSGGKSRHAAALGHAYAVLGKRGEAQKVLAELKLRQPPVSPYEIATVYAGLGDKNEAFKWLEKAYQQNDYYLAFSFNVNPKLDRLRSDPRFQNLVRRMNFPH